MNGQTTIERERKFLVGGNPQVFLQWLKDNYVKSELIFQVYLDTDPDNEVRLRMCIDGATDVTTYHKFTKKLMKEGENLERVETDDIITHEEFDELTRGLKTYIPITKDRYWIDKNITFDVFTLDDYIRDEVLLEVEYPDDDCITKNTAFLKMFSEKFPIKEVTHEKEWRNANIFNHINRLLK